MSLSSGIKLGPYEIQSPLGARERKTFTIPKSTMDDLVPNSWSLDDQQILCTRRTASGDHLELMPVAGEEPTRFLTSKGSETNGQISPDGKWVAYPADESGNWEIYVTSFPGAAGKWQVSRGGGSEPRWRGDGDEERYGFASSSSLGATGSHRGTPGHFPDYDHLARVVS